MGSASHSQDNQAGGEPSPDRASVRRAHTLLALASAVCTDGVNPESRSAPGVGQYISRAIAVGARNEPLAMVDTNWVRVIRRVFAGRWMSDYRYDSRLQSIAQAVVDASRHPRAVNWAILDLGAALCRPRLPRCPECPAREFCDFARRAPPGVDGQPEKAGDASSSRRLRLTTWRSAISCRERSYDHWNASMSMRPLEAVSSSKKPTPPRDASGTSGDFEPAGRETPRCSSICLARSDSPRSSRRSSSAFAGPPC